MRVEACSVLFGLVSWAAVACIPPERSLTDMTVAAVDATVEVVEASLDSPEDSVSDAASCVTNAKQCEGTSPQTCAEDGQWRTEPACEFLCLDGNCAGNCHPREKGCDRRTPKVCSEAGQWVNQSECPFACAAGACVGACVPETKECVSDAPRVCDAVGEWEAQSACTDPTPICHDGACVLPQPTKRVISAGPSHTCALTDDRGARCWGYNILGQLGDNTTMDAHTPVDVIGLGSGVSVVEASNFRSCALSGPGKLQCWGKAPSTTYWSDVPEDVVGLNAGVVGVAQGLVHSCALTEVGGVFCWGDFGNARPQTSPVSVSGLSAGVLAITAGNTHTCALTIAGSVKCWGSDAQGQLGNPNAGSFDGPVEVAYLDPGILGLDAGGYHTCVVTKAGGVMCWGHNEFGQLGVSPALGKVVPVPIDVHGMSSGVVSVSGGDRHTCAQMTNGTVRCWGNNDTGQLGNGSTVTTWEPQEVVGLSGEILSLSAGHSHTCVLTSTGAKCWGQNSSGQLGDGSTHDSPVPVDVIGL